MANVLAEQGGKLDAEQRRVVKQILGVGRKAHATPRELVTALVTGLQESGLRNLPVGAESSGGWRQERAIYYPDPTNVKHAAERFYKELKERSSPGQSIGQAAQEAQRSAYPSAYQPHVGEARTILKEFNQDGYKGKTKLPPEAKQKATGATKAITRRIAGETKTVEGKPFLDKNSSTYKLAALEFIRNQKNPEALGNFLAAKQQAVVTPTSQVKLPGRVVTESVKGQLKENTGKPKLPQVQSKGNQGLVKWASAVEGTNEGSPKQQKWDALSGISGSTPWCSAFVAYGLRKQGYTLPDNPAYSGAWLDWSQGKKVNYKNVKPGDLLIFDWGDGGITDHVAIYAGHGEMIAGNDSNDSVGRSSVPVGNVVGVVRPTKKKKRRSR